jgi:hypothetical protein
VYHVCHTNLLRGGQGSKPIRSRSP